MRPPRKPCAASTANGCAHVGDLFARARLAGRHAQARAILFYSYLFGQSLLDAKVVPAAARDKAIRALIAPP